MASLLFATELYGLPILRPLAAALRARGEQVVWLVPDAVAGRLRDDETRVHDRAAVQALAPQAVYCAANWVSPALPGTKVQLFHGFNAEKRPPGRGHFRLRGFFDLYCTQGPATTAPFRELAAREGYFAVEETGWPKLDPLFGPPSAQSGAWREAAGERPCVLYASTFTPTLSSAPAMRQPLEELVARGDRFWLLTLHPKSDETLFRSYRALAEKYPRNARFVDSEALLDLLQAADALVCDTSSVVDEMAVQLKPVVTVRNRVPRDFLLDVVDPGEVDAALTRALQHPPELMAHIRAHAEAIHPYRDGRSSERVLAAVDKLAAGGFGPLRRKPANLWRRWQARGRLRAMLPGDAG